MKAIKLTLVIIYTIQFCVAQQEGFNYKAIIKDDFGNVISNQSVTIQLTIFEDAAQVYQETHTPTTNVNGLVILTIGAGSTSDTFSDIIWSKHNHTLNTQVDIGSGLVDLGTTAFQSVPYATYAANVSGLEALDEGSGKGWRLLGQDPANYGDIGSNAVDLSISNTASEINGATASYSTALGFNTQASGGFSTAIGVSTKADAQISTAIGIGNIGGGSPNTWVETDPLFEIGNGTSDTNRSNALTVLKNGTIIAPSFDLVEIIDDQALITKEYADANLVASGLEAIDEGNGIGWRLKGQDPANYGNIGENAIDLSYSITTSTTKGATGTRSISMGQSTEASGDFSIALGYNIIASGSVSTAMGFETIASGLYSTSIGQFTEASGDYSTAFGRYSIATGDISTAMGNFSEALGLISTAMGSSTASGSYSTAMGRGTNAEARNTTTIGRYNIGGGNATSWVETDPLFEIGNGSDDTNRSNAFTVLKNGTITAPSFDMEEITDDKALLTKEYADTNLVASGLEAIDDGNGIGWRLKGQDPDNYGEIGFRAVDLSTYDFSTITQGATGWHSIAMGFKTMASGTNSTAMGNNAEASGANSTAMGYNTTASGGASIAVGFETTASGSTSVSMGQYTEALGDYSTALGRYSIASGSRSTAMGNSSEALGITSTVIGNNAIATGIYSMATGNYTNADSYNSTVIGSYNVGGGNPNNWVSADPLFEIGNGTSPSSRTNALTVLKNGDTGIGGNPNANLHVFHGTNAGNDGLKIESTGTNTNFWRLYTVNSSGNLNLFSKLNGTTAIGTFNDATGVYSGLSDRRLKKDFQPLPFTWKQFMDLETLSYLYKVQKDNKRSLGLIAQDVEKIYPELVTYNKEEDIYHLNYSGFGVIAIKAIQELKKEVEDLKAENRVLKTRSNELDLLREELASLKTTVNKLDTKQN